MESIHLRYHQSPVQHHFWPCNKIARRRSSPQGTQLSHQPIAWSTTKQSVAMPPRPLQMGRSAPDRYQPSTCRPLEACCQPWSQRGDATAVAGEAIMTTTTTTVTVKIPHSTFYPPFRKHFHIFEVHILLSAFY